MLKTALAAAALIGTLPGAAQEDSRQYRPLNATDETGILVSTDVAGPQTARRFREVIVFKKRSPTGADAYVADFAVDCPAGTITIQAAEAWQDGRMKSRFITEPGDPERPEAGSISHDMIVYACTGESPMPEGKPVTGLPAAFALGKTLE
ncbi:MAG: hypothetical protein ACAH11_15920 [Sphingomonas sp.]